MSLFSRLNTRPRSTWSKSDSYISAERAMVVSDAKSADEKIDEFGAEFVTAMRRRTAQNPKPLRVHDAIDVFSDTGEFLYRGVVESRDETCAQVRVGQPSPDGDEAESVTYKVKIENCRHADASPPSATLDEWEAVRGTDSSEPPL